jgi:hypothetical protein
VLPQSDSPSIERSLGRYVQGLRCSELPPADQLHQIGGRSLTVSRHLHRSCQPSASRSAMSALATSGPRQSSGALDSSADEVAIAVVESVVNVDADVGQCARKLGSRETFPQDEPGSVWAIVIEQVGHWLRVAHTRR